MTDFAAARSILDDGLRDGTFAAAAVEVGRSTGSIWRAAFGRAGVAEDAPPTSADTVFDLASLTKVIATTTLAMRAVDQGRLDLDAPLGGRLAYWRGEDRASVTAADLLAHASGLTAHLPFYRDHRGREEFEPAIAGNGVHAFRWHQLAVVVQANFQNLLRRIVRIIQSNSHHQLAAGIDRMRIDRIDRNGRRQDISVFRQVGGILVQKPGRRVIQLSQQPGLEPAL